MIYYVLYQNFLLDLYITKLKATGCIAIFSSMSQIRSISFHSLTSIFVMFFFFYRDCECVIKVVFPGGIFNGAESWLESLKRGELNDEEGLLSDRILRRFHFLLEMRVR